MDQSSHARSQGLLGSALVRTLGNFNLKRLNFFARQEGEDLQEANDIVISNLQPELIEGVRTHHLGVEPNCTALGLTELCSISLSNNGRRHDVGISALDLVNQIDAANHIAPLVVSAGL